MIMTENRIWLSSPTMHGEEMKYINEAFEKNWVAPLGFNCDGFEKEMEAYLRLSESDDVHTVALSSGTAAIHLALKLAGVKEGDTVFCSDLTFVATVNPVAYEKAIPVFIDSERETWNMDPKALEKAFEKYPETKVVLLVHLYGVPAKVDEIQKICDEHGAILIEDAAEALSATYNGRACGTFGQYGILSFNGNKIITTSGAGISGVVAKEIAESMGCFEKIDFVDDENKIALDGKKVIGSTEKLESLVVGYSYVYVANEDAEKKLEMIKKIHEEIPCNIVSLVSPKAHVSPSAQIGMNCLVEPMAVVHTNSVLMDGCVIAVGAVVNPFSLCCAGVCLNSNAVVETKTIVPSGTVVKCCEVYKKKDVKIQDFFFDAEKWKQNQVDISKRMPATVEGIEYSFECGM